MKKIIIDTNFLLVPYQFKVDIFSELERLFGVYEAYIIDKTIQELNDIKSVGGKNKIAANIGLELVKQKKVLTIKSDDSTYVDDVIVNFCKKNKDYFVATNDVDLKKRLKHSEINVIQLRQKKYLVIE